MLSSRWRRLLEGVVVAALLDEHEVGGQEHMEGPRHVELEICDGRDVIGEVRAPWVLHHPFAPTPCGSTSVSCESSR